jgi:hypothetical protein
MTKEYSHLLKTYLNHLGLKFLRTELTSIRVEFSKS